MLLVGIAWLYVVLMVAVVEATSEHGTLLGAMITVVAYGLLPLGILGYLFFSPARRRVRRAAQRCAEPSGLPGDDGGHPAGQTVAPVRVEP